MDESTSENLESENVFEYDHMEVIRGLLTMRYDWLTLDAEERQWKAFLDYQRLHKDELVQTGLRPTIFHPSRPLDVALGNLYFTRLPGKVVLSNSSELGWQAKYWWWKDWFAASIDRWYPQPSEEKSSEHTYFRDPDMGSFAGWLRLRKLPELTSDWQHGAFVPFLSKSECERIESARPLLFELKETIISEIVRALQDRDASKLRSRCMDILKGRLAESDFDFYVQAEARYRFMLGNPYTIDEFAPDQCSGGLFALLVHMLWVEQAITTEGWDQEVEVWTWLKNVLQNEQIDATTITMDDIVQILENLNVPGWSDRRSWLEELIGCYEDYALNAMAGVHSFMNEKFNVELPMPRILVPPDKVANSVAALDRANGVIHDYLKSPEGNLLTVLPSGYKIQVNDLEGLGFKPNDDFSRIEWWNGSAWESFEFPKPEKQAIIRKLFIEEAFSPENAIHESRLRSHGRIRDLFRGDESYGKLFTGKSARYWLISNRIRPVLPD